MGRPAEPLRQPDDELTLARRDVEDSWLGPEIQQPDQLIELPDAGRVADDVIAMRDVVELPGIQGGPP